MTGLLVIGEITSEMRDRLEGRFDLHDAHRIDDMTSFLGGKGDTVGYVLTDGHYGVPEDWMDAMPNLALISNYGVGYDAIDVDLSVSRGILVTHTPQVLNDEVATTALMLMLARSPRFTLRPWRRTRRLSRPGTEKRRRQRLESE